MSEPLDSRLRRLRREARDPEPPPHTPADTGGPRASPGARLAHDARRSDADDARCPGVEERHATGNAREPLGARGGSPRTSRPLPTWFRRRRTAPPPTAAPGSVEPPRDLVEERNARGAFAARASRFAHDHRHGAGPLVDVFDAAADWLALVAKDAALAGVDPRRAVYLDTETTGLSGGAGTYVFLCALGTFDPDGFTVWQGFLRGPEDEAAMVAAAAERIAAADAVVSFFGKSFDRHRLEDKMRIHGVAPPFAGRPHLDLYHPCRRLYREALPDGRLQTAEAHLCGVRRADDLPGSRAPEAWFDFLAGRPHRVEDVFRHNQDDVLSLVSLTAHLGRLPASDAGDDDPGRRVARRAGVARLLLDERRAREALAWIDRALPGASAPAARDLRLLRASAWRELGDPAAAVADLRAAAAEAADDLACRAWIEVAKLEEHARRDPRAALDACHRARAVADALLAGRASVATDLRKREARLTSKLARLGT